MYPVDLHTHTLASSHAYSTIHDYIAIAKQKGIRLFANTDHGPWMDDAPHYWHFVNLEVIPRIVDGVGIIRGIEANIANDKGNIDCNERMLGILDFVIAGFHEPVFAPADCETNTKAMVNAIRSGIVHVISHPGNPKYPINTKEVAQAAFECEVALEINDSSFYRSRPGSGPNCLAIAEAVRDAGGWVALGSDSHISYSLGDFENCQSILDEAHFPQDKILNVSPRRFLDFLQRRTGKIIKEFADF